MLALVESNSWGWGSARIIGLLVVAVVGLGAFLVIERRSAAPIVDFAFFRSRSFVGANIVAFTISFAMFAVFFFLALYMQNILGYSPLETGVRFLPSTLVIMFAGPLSGRLSDRVGPRTPLVIGLLLVAASLAWQSRMQVDTSFSFLVPAFILLGAGMGFTMSPMSTAAMNAVDRSKAGVASGTLSMTRMVGGTFGVAAHRRARGGDRPPRPRAVAPPGAAGGARAARRRARLRRRAHGRRPAVRAATRARVRRRHRHRPDDRGGGHGARRARRLVPDRPAARPPRSRSRSTSGAEAIAA